MNSEGSGETAQICVVSPETSLLANAICTKITLNWYICAGSRLCYRLQSSVWSSLNFANPNEWQLIRTFVLFMSFKHLSMFTRLNQRAKIVLPH